MSSSIVTEPKSRRQFLRLSGAWLALPLLPSLLPRSARAQAESPPAAVVSVVLRNGAFARDFATHTAPAALQSVADPTQPWAQIRQAPLSSSTSGGLNDIFTANIVQGYLEHFIHLDGLDFPNSLGHNHAQLGFVGHQSSFDQLAAKVLSGRVQAPVASLELTNPGAFGARSSSYRREADGAVTHLPSLVQPAALYDRLFGLAQPGTRASVRRSLGHAQAQADRLRSSVLSKSDAEVLGRYLQGLSELSTRIATQPALSCTPGARPADGVTELEPLADLQTSLAALAVACGVKEVSIFVQSARLADGRTYDPQWWHNDSHSYAPSVPEFLDASRWVARAYFMAMVRKLDQLGAWPSSMVLLTNEMKSGRLHNNENQPLVLACGPAVSTFKQRGVYVSYQRANGGPPVPQTSDFHGLLINQFFNTVLAAQGLTPAQRSAPGEPGYGTTTFANPDRRALYASVLPGAGMTLPWLT